MGSDKFAKVILPVGIAVISGVLLTFLIFYNVYSAERRVAQNEFNQIAAHRYQAISTEIDDHFETLYTLREFHNAFQVAGRNEFSETEFRANLRNDVRRQASIKYLFWVPRDQQKTVFPSMQSRNRNGEPFLGPEFHPLEKLGLDPTFQFSIKFVVPSTGGGRFHGKELHEYPGLKRVMKQAMIGNRPIATMEIPDDINVVNGTGVLVFLPVFRTVAVRDNQLPGDPETLAGFSVALLDLEQLVVNSLDKSEFKNLRIFLYGERDLSRRPLLFSYESGVGDEMGGYYARRPLGRGLSLWQNDLNVGGLQLSFVAAPTGEFMDSHNSWEPEIVLTMGLLFTGLLGIYLYSTLTRMDRIKRLVREKSREISRRKHVEKQLQILANHDSLTDLFNRGHFQDRLREEIQRSERYDRPLSFILIDLDHFKQVNDQYGHPAGDQVLVKMGELLRDMIRASDIAARFGGEEFSVALPETEGGAAKRLANRIREALGNIRFSAEGSEYFSVTCSAGVTVYRHGEEVEEMIQRADAALYEAKDRGRNRVITRFPSQSEENISQ